MRQEIHDDVTNAYFTNLQKSMTDGHTDKNPFGKTTPWFKNVDPFPYTREEVTYVFLVSPTFQVSSICPMRIEFCGMVTSQKNRISERFSCSRNMKLILPKIRKLMRNF